MFKWFSGRKKQEHNAKATLEGSIDAVTKLGALMEDHAGSILDTSMLPLPKLEMKTAIKILWAAFPDGNQRDVLEVGYLSLANFQDGVGKTPINLAMPETLDPKEVVASLGATMPWMNKSTAEMQELVRELDAFKKDR